MLLDEAAQSLQTFAICFSDTHGGFTDATFLSFRLDSVLDKQCDSEVLS